MLYLVSLLVLFYIYIISLFANLCICVFYISICILVYFCICIFVYDVRQGEQLSVAGWSQGWRDPVLPAPLLGSLLLLPPPWLACFPACLAGHPAGEIRYCAISLSSHTPPQFSVNKCACASQEMFFPVKQCETGSKSCQGTLVALTH